MEQKSRKKGILIAFITLVALMFLCGAIFTIIKDSYDDQTQNYQNHQSQIDEYDKSLGEWPLRQEW